MINLSVESNRPTFEEMTVEMELWKALEQNEFFLQYQPKLDLTSGKIIGAEALIRWQHPEKGVIAPAEFIPLAEETGLILPIGEWVLRTACLQNKAWEEAGLPLLVISVNFSVRQLFQPGIVKMVRQVLEETGLPSQYLEIEITESIFMDTDQGLKVLNKLKDLGVNISLDDFGTGYSSLNYLREFPIHILKIDQSFVRNCTSDLNNTALVKTIIAMAHQLQMRVIAEGIESKDQLIFLQQNFCNEGQGYLFSKPLSPEEFLQTIYDIEAIIDQKGIPHNVYHQKLKEEELEQGRQELNDTLRLQQGMIFKLIKDDGKFIYTLCDGELLYRIGLTPEQVIGKELGDFFSASEEETASYFHRAWAGEENVSYESEINGIHFIVSLRPVRRGGQVTEVIGSCVDITNQKRAEEALRESETKHRMITENILDLIIILDKNGVIQYASPSHKKVLGLSPESYEGHPVYDWVHPDDLSYLRRKYPSIFEYNEPFQVQFRCKHANGSWIFVESQLTSVYDEKNEVVQFIGVGRDISERKRTEELLRISEKLSVVSELSTNIAHEIRSPLTTIKGFVQLLENESVNPLYIDTMKSELLSIEDSINELLSFAHAKPVQ